MTPSTGMVLATLVLCGGSFGLVMFCLWLASRARRKK